MDVRVTNLKNNRCEKKEPLKKTHRCAELHKIESNPET
jgi:hypothetical protein